MNRLLENFARNCTAWVGTSQAFSLAIVLIILWLLAGPYYDWSDSHSLWVNSVTTVITFLMVFLLQRNQNKDSFAIQMKLNEIIAAISGCSNRLINVEDLSEDEIIKIYKRYQKLATKAKLDESWNHQHTVEEIDED